MIFNLTATDLINTLFIAGGIGVCGLCFMQISASFHIRKDVRRYFQVFFVLITLYISAHLARLLMNGISGNGVRVALYIVTFIEMIAAGFMAHMMSMLVVAVARPERNNRRLGILLFAFLIAHIVVIAVGWPLDLIYSFDKNNAYRREAGYAFSNLFPLLMLLTDMILLIKYRKNIEPRIRVALWNYMIAPIIAIAIQTIVYGIQLIIFATVGAAIYMFGVIMQRQNERYEKQKMENSRIESELTLASNIQADMLPNIFPAFPDRREFDIYASMSPAKEVGGDFYDFFLVDDDHLCMVMADVSGKGVPAALFMMASKIFLANNAMLGKSPEQILTDTNAATCSHNREEMFVTVWLGILEISTGKLTAANAGHEYPVLKQPNGRFDILKDQHGFVIGGMNGIKYKQYELQLQPGSKLFLYTDGVPEATRSDNELFGTEHMLAALNDGADASPDKLLDHVRTAVNAFVAGAEQFDDLTMLGLEYKGV